MGGARHGVGWEGGEGPAGVLIQVGGDGCIVLEFVSGAFEFDLVVSVFEYVIKGEVEDGGQLLLELGGQ